ncbi:hypothetical protein MPL3365_140259 [Mesorhizobium plurifarium]|uniref:Uncharacterized protein n=1 Tax=Mesorhizobium plurifarium TaxID=69974 RepID=A0A090G4T4_MESPL|nr:hypothetical protein MPL3365_140259 [Mesorhizobium plurifarium]
MHDLKRLLGGLAFKVGFEGIELFLKRHETLQILTAWLAAECPRLFPERGVACQKA